MSSHYLRFHVKQVAHGHVGVALAVAVSLREQLFLGPGHVNPLGPGLGLVIYRAMRRRVSVMNELSLIDVRQNTENSNNENDNNCRRFKKMNRLKKNRW